MQNTVLQSIDECIRAMRALRSVEGLHFIETAAEWISECFRKQGKLLIAGNGGSLCDAMHFAEELTGQFRKKRAALPAIALSDPGYLTCVANDMGYESVFARGVEAFGCVGDIFIAMTTSGNSQNLVAAMDVAKERGLKTVAFLGKTGGKMRGLADLEWVVSGFAFSDRIQEAHMAAIHIIIEQVEQNLFYAQSTVSVGSQTH
ncbi:MAG: SIS domain-containing protein [Chlamydiia bacterium]|nr:SIS domain-containing protein [Chlamydiia bacterium]